ncbi:hypothetical protein WG899_09260 [Paucibacter sp. AS339]|uniref:hypothetical protein n=1 Tax=Paucibacter hankyongi TaxID=3133434 RepID=UPI0030A969DC
MLEFSLLMLAFAVLLVLLSGLLSALRQLFFLRCAYLVRGAVIGEWRYLRFGRVMRYYRVEFQLANGQRAELRSRVTSFISGPKLGQWVPVLNVERPGQGPRAKIGTWAELWFSSALLLAVGGLGALFLTIAVAQMGLIRS